MTNTPLTKTDSPPPSVPPVGRVLVVDDEPALLEALKDLLAEHGYEVITCGSGREALAALVEGDFEVVLTDLLLPGLNGMELLRRALDEDPDIVVVVMTGCGTIETAVEAMKTGAYDYLLKPLKLVNLLPVLDRAIRVRHLRLDNLQLRQAMAIYELGQTISHTLAVDVILDKVADGALQQCDADEASIMLPTEDGDSLHIAAVRGEERHALQGQQAPIDRHIAGWVAQNREPLILDGEVRDPRYPPLRPRPEISRSTSIPLLAGGKLVGVLNVNFTRRRRPLAGSAIKALNILAAIAAAALHGSRLYREAGRAEEGARESREELERVLDTMGDGLMVLDADDRLTRANARMCEMLGRSEEELLGKDYTCWTHPDSTPRMARELERRKRGASSTYEAKFVRADGSSSHVLVTGTPIMAPDRTYRGAVGCVTDITARREAEEALRASHAELTTIYENAPTITVLVDSERRVCKANRAATQHAGCSEQELDGMRVGNALRCLHSLDDPQGCGFGQVCQSCAIRQAVLEAMETGRSQRRTEVALPFERDGRQELLYFLVSAAPVEIADERRVLVYLDDITERKRAEQSLAETNDVLRDAMLEIESSHRQVIQQERLRALGQMASGIAHDFNNALMPVLGYSELPLANPEILNDHERMIGYLETMNASARAAADVVKRLREFYRPREDADIVEGVNLEDLIAEALSLTQPKWRDQTLAKGLVIETAAEVQGAPVVAGDFGELRELLTNLILNAVDAMPEGGNITVRASLADPGEGEPTHAVLAVTDTGTGMTEEVRQSCLEPFFSTKGEHGTGLGLAMVYGTVKRHEGAIDIVSEVGEGTTFQMQLPLYTEAGVRYAGDRAETSVCRGLGVLLVDDEPLVRKALSAYLELDEHRVDTAEAGQAGLDRFDPEKHDLVLTDRAMPGMNGDELARAVKERSPNTPVIMLTGFGDMMAVSGERPDGIEEILPKPTTVTALRQVISKAMAQ